MNETDGPETLAPGISLYKNVIENTQDIIDSALSMSNWRQSAFMLSGNKKKFDKAVRNTKVLDIPYNLEGDIFTFSIAKVMYIIAKDYCERWNTGFSFMEHPQILHYESGEGHYEKHIDSSPDNPRVFSSILYLNDIENGGETYFTHFDLSIPPRAGNIVMFPAEYSYEHIARPPLDKDKFVVVTWFRPWEPKK